MRRAGGVSTYLRWTRALVQWHATVFREEMRHNPVSRSMWPLVLVGGAFGYVPLVAVGTETVIEMARQAGLNPPDAAAGPLIYGLLLALVIGSTVSDAERWWVIRVSPAPRWLLGADRTMVVYVFTLAVAGPYAWGALRGASLQPAAAFSVVAMALALGTRMRLAGRLGYALVVILAGLVGWANAFFVHRYLSGSLPLDDPNHELARDFLIPILSHGRVPSFLQAFFRLPALAHVALALLTLAWMAQGLGRAAQPTVLRTPLRWLGRWRDAAASLAWARLLQAADSGVPQAVATAAFGLALEAYGAMRAPTSLWLWLALAALWRPVWMEPLEPPDFFQANTVHPERSERLLLEGRLMALAQSSFLAMLLVGRPVSGFLLGASWLALRRYPAVLLALPAGWPRGLAVAVLGALLGWWGG